MWSTLATNDNNVYFDVNSADVSKMIILVANLHSNTTQLTATAGFYWIGTSGSAATNSSKAYPYSAAKVGRLKLKSTAASAKAHLTAAANKTIQISAFGPFETARFKTSQGYVKFAKGKAALDGALTRVAAILIP